MAKKHLFSYRHTIQVLWAFLTNSYLVGFFRGTIYQGPTKSLCVPGLNCYSCPGALGACPIGALQAVMGSWRFSFAFSVVGFLAIVGGTMGRIVCGFLCPFGLLQEILFALPFFRKLRHCKGEKYLRFLKYIILVVFVLLLPLLLVDVLGQGAPYFCKLLCPVGALEGGIPLVLQNPSLQQVIGGLYAWKLSLLLFFVVLSLLIYRPFCKYFCPLGAIYGLCNPIALFRHKVDSDICIQCGRCTAACPMELEPAKTPNSPECIRCGNCRAVCPTKAIHWNVQNPCHLSQTSTKKGV